MAAPFPEAGPGSVAGLGARTLAFLIDGLLADVVSILVLGGYGATTVQNAVVAGAFLLIELLFVWLAGQTPGMRVLGVVVVRADNGHKQQFGWVLVRTALIATLVPALVVDRYGRAMHDRAAGTVMLRTR